MKPFIDQLNMKFLKFVKSSLASGNTVLRPIAMHSMYSEFGFFNRRLRNLLFANADSMTILSLDHMMVKIAEKSSLEVIDPHPNVILLKELVSCRDGFGSIGDFDYDQINFLIWYCSVT